MTNIHATCICLKRKGVLLLGPSGAGKSDLALRAIINHKAQLVADDRVDILLKNNHPYASSPKNLQGLLEVRGVGIIKQSFKLTQQIHLVVELVDNPQKIERLPEPEFFELQGVLLPKLKLYPFEVSSLEKLVLTCKK